MSESTSEQMGTHLQKAVEVFSVISGSGEMQESFEHLLHFYQANSVNELVDS